MACRHMKNSLFQYLGLQLPTRTLSISAHVMSSNQTTFTSSSSSFSYSSSSSSSGGQISGQRSMQQTYTDPSGNTIVKQASQTLGEPIMQETRSFDSQGRETLGGSGSSSSRRIEDVSDEEQAKRDREYEERIEEEYAKREGGA